MDDEDPFKPLSARTSRPAYSVGGRPMNATFTRLSEDKKLANALRKLRAARRKAKSSDKTR